MEKRVEELGRDKRDLWDTVYSLDEKAERLEALAKRCLDMMEGWDRFDMLTASEKEVLEALRGGRGGEEVSTEMDRPPERMTDQELRALREWARLKTMPKASLRDYAITAHDVLPGLIDEILSLREKVRAREEGI